MLRVLTINILAVISSRILAFELSGLGFSKKKGVYKSDC